MTFAIKLHGSLFPSVAIATCILASSCLAAQSDQPIAETSFEIVGGRIYVDAEVNGHKTKAILDSGAGATVIDLEAANRWSLPSQGNLNAEGGGGAVVHGKFVQGASIKFAGIQEPVSIALPLSSMNPMEGRAVETVVGFHFWDTHIVEVNYQTRRLRVFERNSSFKPSGTPVPIRIVSSLCQLKAELNIGDKQFRVDSLVDTGASASALTTKFLKQHPLKVSATPLTDLGAGIGGTSRGRTFRPDQVVLAGRHLSRPVVALTESGGGVVGEHSSFDFLLGADILRRFTVTFDYAHHQIYFLPNSDVMNPFEADKTGLRIFAEGSGLHTYRVKGVLPGSAGEAAQIKVDDVIEAVDGVLTNSFSLQELRDKFRAPVPKVWTLDIRRGSDHLSIKIQGKAVI